MTDQRIQEIQKRCDTATPGPWIYSEVASAIWADRTSLDVVVAADWGGIEISKSDAAFIAHAREDIPFLLSQLAERDKEIERLRELADAERDGRCVVLPCKVGDTVDRLFSHNEIIAIWEEHKNEEASPKYLLWKGMAHALPAEYSERVFLRVFGTIPESMWSADVINILVTPIITPALKGTENERL